METNNNKPLQQKTFNKTNSGIVSSNKAIVNNKPLQQKTFNNRGTNNKTKHVKLNKTLQKQKKLFGNVSTAKYVRGLMCAAWIVILGILNYSILYKLDFRVRTGMDWVYLIVMLVMSVSAGVYYFVNELEKRDGYILKYIVAVIIGICGNFAGLLFSLIV